MAVFKIEALTGLINGSNTTFFTSVPYTAGSLAVYLNGQLIIDGYTETDPSTGEVTLDVLCTPRPGDKVEATYCDTSTDPNIVEIVEIRGTITDVGGNLVGVISTTGAVIGTLTDLTSLSGLIVQEVSFYAKIEEFQELKGTLEIC